MSVFLNLVRLVTQLLIKQKFRDYYSLFSLLKLLHKMFKNNTNHIKPVKPISMAPWDLNLDRTSMGRKQSRRAK